MEWLAAKSALGIARGWLILGAIAAILALLLALRQAQGSHDTNQQDLGAAAQREADLQNTLERTEQANAARTEIRDDRGTARYDQCLRTARTPALCQRFLPGGEADHR